MYWLSEAGALCSDKGAYPLTDRDECRDAMPFVKSELPSAKDDIGYDHTSGGVPGWPERPHGCFLNLHYQSQSNKVSNVKVHWNPSLGNRNIEDQQVCKTGGK